MSLGFNRYIVECKYQKRKAAIIIAQVLIDTQWNVNLDRKGFYCEECRVLIDTQWNVNTEKRERIQEELRVLIDTQWNVNFYPFQLIPELFVF